MRIQFRRLLLATSASLVLLNGCSDDQIASYDLNASVATTNQAMGRDKRRVSHEYRLRLYQLHTHESLDVVYRRGDEYLQSGIEQLNHFLRDYRTGDDAYYPVAEFDLLHDVLARLGQPTAVIDIVCGYRTAETNGFLRTRSAHTGVAEHSQHILSQAIDIRVPGVSTETLRDAALSLHRGGVGYYPISRFVHVDVGPVRQWAFGVASRRGARRANTDRSTVG